MKLYILGIDPGTRARNPAGGALLAFEDGSERLVEVWEWKPTASAAHKRIWQVARQIAGVAEEFERVERRLDALRAEVHTLILAYEDAFLGENAQSFKKLANTGGAVIGVGATMGMDVLPVLPSQGKLALSGNGHADDESMRRAAQLRFGLEDLPSAHVAHAIGVALHAEAELRRARLVREAM